MTAIPVYPPRLLNRAKLCEATGFSTSFITAVLSQVDSPSNGGRYCTAEAFNAWVLAHPDFRPSHFWKTRAGAIRPLNLQRQKAAALRFAKTKKATP